MEARTVSVAVKVDVTSGRDILSGILAFTDPERTWRYRIFQSEEELTEEAVREAARTSDGFILALGSEIAIDVLWHSSLPLVHTFQNPIAHPPGPSAIIRNDNLAIGRAGGEHLASLGTFGSYAFVHSRPNQGYTQPRAAGFRAALRERGKNPARPFRSPFPEGSEEDVAALADWLKALPKPTAIMAGSDRRAIHVLTAAQHAGIPVPEHLAIVGVDNDALLVEHSTPPLTSVLPGHFEIGFTAAAELKRLMDATRKLPVRITNVPPKSVVVRESTRRLPPAAMLVERARKFIAQRATSGIGVEDVVAHLGCSRNLADLRYKATEGMTVHAAIEAARLDAVMHLLKTTRRSVATIAAQCGFKSANRLTHLFKQRTGRTIREWRVRH